MSIAVIMIAVLIVAIISMINADEIQLAIGLTLVLIALLFAIDVPIFRPASNKPIFESTYEHAR